MEKLPKESFDSFLANYMSHRLDVSAEIKLKGGQSTGINLIVKFDYNFANERNQPTAQITVCNQKLLEKTVHELNWRLWLDNKNNPPFFVMDKWSVKAGPTYAKIHISLSRNDEAASWSNKKGNS